jgi:hypothetical protein
VNVHGRYLVTGRTSYRGHEPGTEFEATLDENVERRALYRGAIKILERVVPKVREGSYRLPRGWLD